MHMHTHMHTVKKRETHSERGRQIQLARYVLGQTNELCMHIYIRIMWMRVKMQNRPLWVSNYTTKTLTHQPNKLQTGRASEVIQGVPLESQRSPAPKGTPHPTPTHVLSVCAYISGVARCVFDVSKVEWFPVLSTSTPDNMSFSMKICHHIGDLMK